MDDKAVRQKKVFLILPWLKTNFSRLKAFCVKVLSLRKLRWSSIVRLGRSKFVRYSLSGFFVIPLLAVVLTLLREKVSSGVIMASYFGDVFAEFIQIAQYPVLLLCMYFAFLGFLMSSLIVTLFCPVDVLRYKNFQSYFDSRHRAVIRDGVAEYYREIIEDMDEEIDSGIKFSEGVLARIEAGDDDLKRELDAQVLSKMGGGYASAYYRAEVLRTAKEYWDEKEFSYWPMKVAYWLFTIPSVVIVIWGLFVYVPNSVLQNDDLSRIFGEFMICPTLVENYNVFDGICAEHDPRPPEPK